MKILILLKYILIYIIPNRILSNLLNSIQLKAETLIIVETSIFFRFTHNRRYSRTLSKRSAFRDASQKPETSSFMRVCFPQYSTKFNF